MRVVIAFGLLATLSIGQISGSFLENVKDFLANPSMGGGIMKMYMNLKLGKNYKSPYTNLFEYVKFNLYTRNNKIFSQSLKVGDEELLNKSNFDASKPTFIIVHGYINNIYMPAIQVPKNALLKQYDCNVIGVDWGSISITHSYPTAAAEVSRVGGHVAEMAKFLMSSAGLDLKKTHLIGHSLGAQVCGFAGKNLKGLGLARITGLDPALPGFADEDLDGKLDGSDADYVDCIHTCSGSLGFEKPICQADFYPNGGKKQPGCPLDINGICSHLRAIDYYAESVSPANKFKATKCTDVPDVKGSGCSISSALMGEPANSSYRGIFYVKTNSRSPYASAS